MASDEKTENSLEGQASLGDQVEEMLHKPDEQSQVQDQIQDEVEEAPQVDDGVEFSRLEGNGILVDAQGNTWCLPTDEEEDALLPHKSELDVPVEAQDPLMHYQWEKQTNVAAMMTEQFVPVTRKELGLKDFKVVGSGEFGSPLDGYHRVGELVLMKTPKAMADRRYKSFKRYADSVVQSTEPVRTADNEEASLRKLRDSRDVEFKEDKDHTKGPFRVMGGPKPRSAKANAAQTRFAREADSRKAKREQSVGGEVTE